MRTQFALVFCAIAYAFMQPLPVASAAEDGSGCWPDQIVGSVLPEPVLSACSYGVGRDSYGLGLLSGMLGVQESLPQENSLCFVLGEEAGKSLKKSPDCVTDFKSGENQGLEASPNSGGSPCFIGGYEAGMAQLDKEARENSSSSSCSQAYQGAYQEASMGKTNSTMPSEQPRQHCFELGLFEGSAAAH